MFFQISHSRHDFGHTGFIVGSEKSRTVGNDKILPHIVGQFRKFRRRKDNAVCLIQHYIAAIVILDYAWRHMASRHIGRRVKMGNETYSRRTLVTGSSGQSRHKVTVIVKSDFRQTYSLKLVFKVARENHLSGRRRCHVGKFVALGVELHILQESVNKSHYRIYQKWF